MKDCKRLYQLQDKVFTEIKGLLGKIYLTGGTALDRFYLHHRHSDDIDLFANDDPDFAATVNVIRRKLESNFTTDPDGLILHDDFVRIWVVENTLSLKIEMVNDVAARYGDSIPYRSLPVDNPGNILANKLTAVVGRDEPKDVFDIISLSHNFSFNWGEIFNYSVQKAVVAEQDVAMRLSRFPTDVFRGQSWIKAHVDIDNLAKSLVTISDDFLFARDNSLGKDKVPISEATVDAK